MNFCPSRFEKICAATMLALTFAVLWAVLIFPIVDGDIWFHMLYGKLMLENQSLLVDHSQFSWTPASNDTIYCAWLGQILYYLLYTRLGGDTGILVFRYVATTLPFVLFIHVARQRGSVWHPLTWLACTAAVLLIPIVIMDKPDLFSFLFSACMVWNWYQLRRGGRRPLLHIYLFPLLILLWVNTHGIFVFGCILLAVIAAGETCNQLVYRSHALPRRLYGHLLAACLLALGCTMLTPYGPEYILQLASSHFQAQNQQNLQAVQAWAPSFDVANPRIAAFAYSAVALLIITLLAALRRKQLDWVPVLMNMLFAYLFTHYIRLTYLWLPIFILTVAYYGATLELGGRPRLRQILLCAAVVLGVGGNGWGLYLQKVYPSFERWPDFGHSGVFTAAGEAAFIAEHFPHAKIGNTYQHGAYLLWRRWPQQVMMDARYFPYAAWFQEYLDFRGGRQVAAFLERYPADIMVVPHDYIELKKALFALQHWQAVFCGRHAMVYAFAPQGATGRPQVQHDQDILRIQSYPEARWVFHSTVLHRDWQGFSMVTDLMQRTFTTPEQQDQIAGLKLYKPVLEHYDRQQYAQAQNFLEQVRQHQAVDPDVQAATDLMLGIQLWEQGKRQQAVQSTLRSLSASETLAANYNLAVMVWQLSRMQPEGFVPDLGLPAPQAASMANWRSVLQEVVGRKSHRPEYLPYMENARKILAGDPAAQTMFIGASWL